MKRVLLVLAICLNGTPGFAQLVLPEFFVEEDAEPEQRFMPGDEGHARGDQAETEGTMEQAEQQMRQMMQAMQGRSPRMNRMERGDDVVEPFERQNFQAGGDLLLMEWTHLDGRQVRRSVPNQTVLVLTAVGRLPVSLHEVEEIRRHEKGMLLTFGDSDQVSGHVDTIYLPAEPPSDDLQVLPLNDIVFIRISIPE